MSASFVDKANTCDNNGWVFDDPFYTPSECEAFALLLPYLSTTYSLRYNGFVRFLTVKTWKYDNILADTAMISSCVLLSVLYMCQSRYIYNYALRNFSTNHHQTCLSTVTNGYSVKQQLELHISITTKKSILPEQWLLLQIPTNCREIMRNCATQGYLSSVEVRYSPSQTVPTVLIVCASIFTAITAVATNDTHY